MSQSSVNADANPNLYDFEELNLDDYVHYRPKYPNKLFDIIYEFHEKAGGKWDAAHDAGCGPGNVAEKLVTQFDQVYASDASARYVEVAQKRAARDLPKDSRRMEFHVNSAEEMSFLGDNSVDMVTIGTAIHWTDPPKTLEAAARVLRPGGTLALFNYGLRGVPDDREIENQMARIFRIALEDLIPSAIDDTGDRHAKFRKVVRYYQTGMDNIELQEQHWRSGARRIWWNPTVPMYGYVHLGRQFSDGLVHSWQSKCKPQDSPTEYIQDPEFISVEADLDWFEGFMHHVTPIEFNQTVKDAMARLEDTLGGRKTKFQLSWPIALLMATKK